MAHGISNRGLFKILRGPVPSAAEAVSSMRRNRGGDPGGETGVSPGFPYRHWKIVFVRWEKRLPLFSSGTTGPAAIGVSLFAGARSTGANGSECEL